MKITRTRDRGIPFEPANRNEEDKIKWNQGGGNNDCR